MESQISMDKAGRIVIPSKLREKLNLYEGCEFNLKVNQSQITLDLIQKDPPLTKEKGVLIVSPENDFASENFLENHRKERIKNFVPTS